MSVKWLFATGLMFLWMVFQAGCGQATPTDPPADSALTSHALHVSAFFDGSGRFFDTERKIPVEIMDGARSKLTLRIYIDGKLKLDVLTTCGSHASAKYDFQLPPGKHTIVVEIPPPGISRTMPVWMGSDVYMEVRFWPPDTEPKRDNAVLQLQCSNEPFLNI